MVNWDGISVGIDNAVAKAMEVSKQRKTQIWVVAGIVALGLIFFIKGK